MDAFLIQILMLSAFGGVCAAIAHSKGRSAIGWFCVGFLLGCIGLIIILCLSNEKERIAKEQAQHIQNRRLEEQLRQEQMKLESMRAHTSARLDRHDTELGIDTKSMNPQIETTQQTNPFAGEIAAPQVPPNHELDLGIWHYELNGDQLGPVSINDLKQLHKLKSFTEDSLVWRAGKDKWEQAKFQPELAKVLYDA